ncbi:MAG: AAA family ATPase [Deltaproteobacteria bacterium]|nr:AAA family ATPase [Deltaproteobacteria bacterium]
MIIRGLSLEGFGMFSKASVQGLSPGINLFVGENEAGKSTCLAFIRAMLFGFPNKKNGLIPYEPIDGTKRRGSLSLEDDALGRVMLFRKEGVRGGPVTLTFADGSAGGQEDLARMLGNVSEALFANVFAFSLDELSTFASLSADQVKSALYGASLGAQVLALPKAQKSLRDQMENLFKPRGKTQAVNSLLKDLKQAEADLAQAAGQAVQYADLERERQALAARIEELSQQEEDLRTQCHELDVLDRLWDDWVELVSARENLKELPEVTGDLPPDPAARLDRLEEALARERRVMEDLLAEEKAVKEGLKEAEADGNLLEAAREIEDLSGERHGRRENEKWVASFLARAAARGREAEEILSALGPGWTKEAVFAADTSQGAAARARKLAGDLEEAQKKAQKALEEISHWETLLDGATDQLEKARARLEEGKAAEGPDEAQALEAEEIRGRCLLLSADLPALRDRLEQEAAALDRAMRSISPQWDRTDLEGFDLSAGARHQAQELAREDLEAREAHKQATAELERARAGEDAEAREAARLEQAVQKEDPQGRQQALESAERAMRSLRRVIPAMQVLGQSTLRTPASLWAGLVLLGLSLAGGGLAWFAGASPAWLVLPSAGAAAGLALAAGSLAAGNKAGEKSALRNQAERAFSELGLEAPRHLDESALDLAEDCLEAARRDLEKARRLELFLEEAQKRLSRESARRDALEKGETQAAKNQKAAQGRWKEFLRERNLPENLPPEGAEGLFARVEAAQNLARRMDETRRRVEERKQALADLARRAACLPGMEHATEKTLERDLEAFRQKAREAGEKRRALEKDRMLAERALEDIRRANDALKKAEGDRDVAEDLAARTLDSWRAWAGKHGLSPFPSPAEALKAVPLLDNARRLFREKERLEAEAQACKRAVEDFDARAAALLSRLGRTPGSDPAAAVSLLAGDLARAGRDQAVRKKHLEDLEKLGNKIAAARRRKEEKEAEIAALLAAAGAEDRETYREKAALAARRDALQQKVERLCATLKKVSGQSDLAVVEQRLAQREAADVRLERKQKERSIESVREQLEQCRRQAARLDHELELLADSDALFSRAETKEELGRQIRDKTREYAVPALALWLLHQAVRRMEEEHQPEVIKEASRFFSTITNGRYHRVVAPLGADSLEVVAADGSRKPAHLLSRGTAEQLYLCFRLGYIRHLCTGGVRLPVVMDDVLVNFDPLRAERTIQALCRLSQSAQILFFTCHPDTARRFADAAPGVSMFHMDQGTIAADRAN